MKLPFSGIRILDLTRVLAGPYCTYQLGLLGAEVTRVEQPGRSDFVRFGGPDPELAAAGLGPGFLAQNANKRSIAVDLKTPEGKEIVRRLAVQADVLTENFRPGVMDRLELGAEQLKRANPALIYCAISGYGQDGPMSERPAYDHVVQAVSGMMMSNSDDSGRPWRVGFPVIDYVAGQSAAFAISTALFQRERTGVGQVVDVAMLDAAVAIMAPALAPQLQGITPPARKGDRAASGSPYSGMFETTDGLLALAANAPHQAAALARQIGRPELLEDPRLKDWGNNADYVDLVQDALAAAFKTASAIEWETRLSNLGVPAGKVRSLGDIADSVQLATRGMVQTIADGITGRDYKVPGVGFKLAGDSMAATAPPPRLGQDTEAVLSDLGYDEAHIARLLTDGVVANK
ncbi:MAG: CoA transferase [Alphaproteobacteria bacterium]|jgi:crotonobetainyl-CoA:carnitine CoA-transferase CaiB-like acyl-CoA transferase|nr:CoA transferase [Rhodospirillaceae bacterium]MDP6021412.1 CoA transferase [Alphaproteobacteria bacterium]MDP6257096.1 CoA transferase [Alphaproteobacteria bacterium]MDP7056621.1 CoA transferase [Alphaproteobacteria bacterium]MDP7230338.1 CoA transferase [Alphaproteobacteria bacterium]|tara:strand:+ start:292 stop:1503 length:1212 start_codon:yes stop_codon:yes gene_type:complete